MPTTPLVVTFSDWAYQPILENWLEHLSTLGVSNVRVYCLDARTERWCRKRSVSTELIAWDGSLGGLWARRLAIFHGLIESGVEFVHSDTDAIWLRNPFLGTDDQYEDDLVFSQGTIWPPEAFERWNLVLCCGWFRVKPSLATLSFFKDLIADVAISGDDQLSVNRLLVRRNLRWPDAPADYELPFNEHTVHCWHLPRRGRTADGSLGVTLLPHAEYQRLPEQTEKAVVKHFLTPKRRDKKVAALRAANLWRLK